MKRTALIAFLLLPAFAQETPKEDAVAPGADELRHVVRLRSGTSLVGKLEPAEWRIKTAFGERVARAIERVGRPGLPGEIAEVIVFLASPESHWLKGNDITIDGGMSALATADQLGL